MYFEKNYIYFSPKLLINSISKYKIIMTKFINVFIELNKINYTDKNLLINDAIIYSKYYLYYKTKNCIYNEEIMKIIFDVDYFVSKKYKFI
jgi:hypothetical protein